MEPFPSQKSRLLWVSATSSWEVAPGQITKTTIPGAETIAYSKDFLTGPSAATPILDGVTFQVKAISAGHKLVVELESDKIRVCSVAIGKAKVKMSGVDEFSIGPHGVFKTHCEVWSIVLSYTF
ncbi:uncharacterized protein C8A04DRAFT_16076 [Dichotomopilus funicola]|uniref:Uncharacterized protein n=1 Tax=Dichotomopilus funicola TaxID=1934379 RepID=A0AAN6UUI1_9PEZI|nr:hypothetical protein C8A04DRAFT_16076 [Dichotomopilus funicola]